MLYVVYEENGVAIAMFIMGSDAREFIKSQPKGYRCYYKEVDAWEHWMSIRDKAICAEIQLA